MIHKKRKRKRIPEDPHVWCRIAELDCLLTLTKGLYYRYTNPAQLNHYTKGLLENQYLSAFFSSS